MAGLKTLVIFMAILIIAGASVLVTLLVQRAGGPAEDKPAVAPPRGAFTLPRGAQILESDLAGERVLLRLSLAGGGQRLVIIDMASGRVIASRDINGAGHAGARP